MKESTKGERPHLTLTDDEIAVAEIVQVLAFLCEDYRPEVVAEYRSALDSRGYGDATVREWREQFLCESSARMCCENCREMLTLDRADLVAGEFSCPACLHTQSVLYRQLRPSVVDFRMFDRLRSDSDYNLPNLLPDDLPSERLIELVSLDGAALGVETRERVKCRLVLRRGNEAVTEPASPTEIPDEKRGVACSAPATTLADFGTSPDVKPEIEPLPDPQVEKMSDTDVLEALAFHRAEYTPDAMSSLERNLVARGYALADAAAWREGGKLSRPGVAGPAQQVVPAGVAGQVLLGLLLGMTALDIILLMQGVPNLNLFRMLSPGSRLGSEDANQIRFTIQALSVTKGLGLVVIIPLFLTELYRACRNAEVLGVPPRGHRAPIFAGAILLAPFSYFLYYSAARETLLASTTDHFTRSAAGDETPEKYLPEFWESVLALANPALLLVLSLSVCLAPFVALEHTAQVETLNHEFWVSGVGLELLTVVATICFVWVIGQAQDRFVGYRSE